MIEGSAGAFMRLALLPLCLAAAPLCAQWDLRLELPFPSGQSLPQTLIVGAGKLASGDLSTGGGYLASLNRQLLQMGPLVKLEGGVEYSQLSANGSLLLGGASQGTRLKQQGIGAGVSAQVWVPFTGIAGELGLIQRLQRYTFDTTGASSARDLSRTWLRVGARWRIPSMVVHPYLVTSYQQPVTKEHPARLSSVSDLNTYFGAQGSGQEFERMWTFGGGVAF
jgi:hypothetical protein